MSHKRTLGLYGLREARCKSSRMVCRNINGLRREKTCLRGFRQSQTKQSPQIQRLAKNSEISLVASTDMVLSKTRMTKALIRLRGCAGWFAPVLFANPRRQVFSRRGPSCSQPIYAEWNFPLLSVRRVNFRFKGGWVVFFILFKF